MAVVVLIDFNKFNSNWEHMICIIPVFLLLYVYVDKGSLTYVKVFNLGSKLILNMNVTLYASCDSIEPDDYLYIYIFEIMVTA